MLIIHHSGIICLVPFDCGTDEEEEEEEAVDSDDEAGE